jgi:hypothetical protein
MCYNINAKVMFKLVMNSEKVWFGEKPLWNGIRFQELVVAHIIKMPVFYGIREFTGLFTKTGSYREPDKSNPSPRILFFNINYNLVLPSTLFFSQMISFIKLSN